MNAVFPILSRSVLAYTLLLFFARVMGRKAISQMTSFEFVVGITIGSVAGTLALGGDDSITGGIIALASLALLTTLLDYLHTKSFWMRKLIDSEPVVVINKGQVVEQNLKRIRFTMDELTMMLREKNVFSVADVEFALMEYDGELSVLPKAAKQPLRPADLNLQPTEAGLTRDIIIDGKLLIENLEGAGYDEQWLQRQLQMHGVTSPQQVFYAGLNASSGSLYLSKKQKEQEEEGEYGIE